MADDNKKHPGGRPTKYNAQFHPLVVEGFAMSGLTDAQIAEKIGIQESTLNNWKKAHPEFMESLTIGKKTPDDLVEESLLRRALGYNTKEITQERMADTGQKVRHGGESKFTEKDWDYAKSAFGYTCAYCGQGKKLTKDHVKPLHAGGELARDNVVPACGKCNSSKLDTPMEDWYRAQPFFSEQRLDKIKTYLAEMQKEQPPVELVVTKVVTKEVPPDTTACIYWTKNRRPDRWRDKQDLEHTGKDGAPLPISFTFVSDPNADHPTK